MKVEYGQVGFTQTRHLAGVRAPLVSRGVATVAPGRVDWRVKQPMDIVTTVTPAGISQSVEGGPAQRVGPQGGGDAFLVSAGLFDLLAGNFSALDAHYTVARAPNGADGAWSMRLTPKAAGLAQVVSQIVVGGCERVQNVEVRQANNDWMTIVLAPTVK